MLPEDVKTHIDFLEQWLGQLEQIPVKLSLLSSEERKQLHTVNKAIEQLQKNRVPVPEELRRLKLQLSAKDHSEADINENDKNLKKIESLIQHMGKIIKKARTIKNSYKASGNVRGTSNYYGVTIHDLMKVKLLSVDDQLELQWLKAGPVFKGKILSDGTIMVKTSEGWKQYNSLSKAATQTAGKSLNGWKHWRLIKKDETSVALEDIRLQYMNKEAGR